MVVRPADPLGLVEAGPQLVAVGLDQGVPDVTHRLALHPGDVGQRLAHRHGVGHSGEMVAQQVVETEPPLVAQLHDQHGGEGLGVGGDHELVVHAGGRPSATSATPMPSDQSTSPPRHTAATSPGTRPSRWCLRAVRRSSRVVLSCKGVSMHRP